MDSHWKRLPLSGPRSKVFLYKIHFASDSYVFQVTDLNQLWIESLHRRDLMKRAFADDISIDPSESPEQLKLLFQHLTNALEGKPDTSLEIEKASSDGMHFLATTKLPGNLPPLKWKLTPYTSNQASLADTLVLPALQSIVQFQNQTVSLMEQLREKDRVISKLLSKLETSGIELATAFPNIQYKGSRATSREVMSKFVKGLGEFDESKWKAVVSLPKISDRSLEDLLDAVLPFEGSFMDCSNTSIKHESEHGTNVSSEVAQKASQFSVEPGLSIAYDNALQKQVVPEKNQRPSLTISDVNNKGHVSDSQIFQMAGREDDTATEDSDNLDISTKSTMSSSRIVNKSHTASSSDSESKAVALSQGRQKLGIIGGKKPITSSSEEDDPPSSSVVGQRTFGKIGGNSTTPIKFAQEVRGLSKTLSARTSRSSTSSRETSPVKLAAASNRLQPELSKVRAPPEVVQETSEEKTRRKRQEAKEIESRKAPVWKKRKF